MLIYSVNNTLHYILRILILKFQAFHIRDKIINLNYMTINKILTLCDCSQLILHFLIEMPNDKFLKRFVNVEALELRYI